MQRLNVDDLVGFPLEQGGWEHLNLLAIAEVGEQYRSVVGGAYQVSGRVLHPEREPLSVLDELRQSMGSMDFSAQYLQQRISAATP